MTTEFFPEQTIRYKTYAKRTLVEGLKSVFSNHPDELLQRTKASIEYPKTEVDYPAVLVRFFERDIFNAGVGHQESVKVSTESDSIELTVTLSAGGAVQLDWAPITFAVGYKVYKGSKSEGENESFTVTANTFTDNGLPGVPEAPPTEVTSAVTPPQPTVLLLPPGTLGTGTYYYRVTAIFPQEAVKFQHYFYTADIEFAVFGLSAYDRDLVADSLVQTIAMGKLEAYTSNFFERIYPANDLFPDSELHFININSDKIQGSGESEAQVPWGAEDDLMYQTAYRVGVFGELYSLPPKLTYGLVRKIIEYPYIGGLDPVPQGTPGDTTPWISNSVLP